MFIGSSANKVNKGLLQYRVLYFWQCQREIEGKRERNRVKANEIEGEREKQKRERDKERGR